jgi:CubicO group peptidase (beta-lactamase class C family)
MSSGAPRFFRIVLLAGAALAASQAPLLHADEPGGRFVGVERVLKRAIGEKVFPGCAVAVGTSGGVLYCRGFGRLDYDQGAEATAETLYDLASLTKVVGTTSVVATLVRDKKLRLDDPVEKFVPEFVSGVEDPEQRAWRERVTVEHLLTHTSGLPAWKPLYREVKGYDEIIGRIVATPLEVEPGARTRYSDLGMMLMGEVAARAGGKSLEKLERERVFAPLAMNDTLRNPPQKLLARVAPTERRAEGEGYWRGVVHDENARAGEGLTGHAGLFSTAADLSRWAGEWLRAARGESKIFPPKIAAAFTRPREVVAGASRALGWDTRTPRGTSGQYFSPASFGHTGFTGTSVWIDPQRDLYVLLLTNAVHPQRGKGGMYQVRRAVADAAVEGAK